MTINFFIFGLGISFLLQLIFFVVAFSFKTDKVTDLSFSLSFFLIGIISYYFVYSKNLITFILLLALSIWAVRLGIYLLVRIINMKIDHRFDNMRNSFVKFGAFWILQAITVWIVILPVLSVFSFKPNGEEVGTELSLGFISIAGIIIWILGFVIETVADVQKYKFKKVAQNKDKWIQTGLWAYSRHPNYFGEILIWWGIFLIGLPLILQQSMWHFLSVISPLYISYMLIFISGVPLIEKKYDVKYQNNPDYAKYKATTSKLILWFKN